MEYPDAAVIAVAHHVCKELVDKPKRAVAVSEVVKAMCRILSGLSEDRARDVLEDMHNPPLTPEEHRAHAAALDWLADRTN